MGFETGFEALEAVLEDVDLIAHEKVADGSEPIFGGSGADHVIRIAVAAIAVAVGGRGRSSGIARIIRRSRRLLRIRVGRDGERLGMGRFVREHSQKRGFY